MFNVFEDKSAIGNKTHIADTVASLVTTIISPTRHPCKFKAKIYALNLRSINMGVSEEEKNNNFAKLIEGIVEEIKLQVASLSDIPMEVSCADFRVMVSFMMGQHPRLGSSSLISKLPRELALQIVKYALDRVIIGTVECYILTKDSISTLQFSVYQYCRIK